jgi:hypothetical protein
MIIGCGVVLFWSGLFGVLETYYICMGTAFSRFGKFSVIILLNILHISFFLHLFFYFNAHYSQVWPFVGVAEFLHIPFTALELFD